MDGRSSPAPARSSSTPPQWRARAGQLRSARWSASVFSAISHSGRCAACASKPSLASAQRQSSAQTFVDGISRLCIMSVVRFIVTGSVRICIRIQEPSPRDGSADARCHRLNGPPAGLGPPAGDRKIITRLIPGPADAARSEASDGPYHRGYRPDALSYQYKLPMG